MGLKLKDYFSLYNIRNFFDGKWNKFKQNSKFFGLEQHIQEQAVYRASLCEQCYEAPACLECGCGSPDLFYSPKKIDALGKWGEMLPKEEWEKFKEENNIDMNSLNNEFTRISKEEPKDKLPEQEQKEDNHE